MFKISIYKTPNYAWSMKIFSAMWNYDKAALYPLYFFVIIDLLPPF